MRGKYDVIVIGGGIIGTLTLRELTRHRIKTILLEKGGDLSSGATRANSAVIHAGFDPEPGTAKAKYNVEGSLRYEQLCRELHVRYERLPSLVVAYSDDQMPTVEGLYRRGMANCVPQLSIVDKGRLRKLEPNISDLASGALFAESSAIVEPWMVAVGAAENAVDNGAEVMVNARVKAILKTSDGFEVTAETPDGDLNLFCTVVINAAGVYADNISAMLTTPDYKITGRRGHYILLDKASRSLVNNILFPCPTALGKGMLILPEIHGRIMLGPDASDILDKSDVRTTAEGIALVKKTVAGYLRVPIPYGLMIRTFSGVRPVPSTGDFIVRQCPGVPGFIEAAGIESPGLASAPAISRAVATLAVDAIGGARENAGFNPFRRAYIPNQHNSKTAHIVCRCEKVSEAEIVDAIHRNCGARTVKGVKLRTGAGAGGCQSGFCQPSIVNILSRELGIDKTEVLYDGPGSNILTGKTRGGAENA